ncbi:cytidine deaminase [Acidisoma cladoniae]|jgi:cytidine deaminase|uniref:cytidine deaminase n=1 Tax=Acidisoma cladoniae TaxID=3040935 RepID=UPI00254BC3A9|nr:cytidine deaminase [Acidisoma sp. PAMC 29798]
MTEGHVIPPEAIAPMMRRLGLETVEALMLALLPEAQALARPPLSAFRVGAVGREAETGALVMGANVEFLGADLGETIHAEQFLFSRAFHRGATLDLIAVSARPCGHCRQFMTEFAGRDRLMILDSGGDRLSLNTMLPFNFSPADLGETGATAAIAHALPTVLTGDIAPALLDALRVAGARAHAPYSRSPSAVLLRLTDGTVITGSAIENAAYNPGLRPIQSALINLIAAGRQYDEIDLGILGSEAAGAIDHAPGTARLLGLLAPHAGFDTVTWRSALSS